MVLLSHSKGAFWGVNLGVTSVVSFFLLAGYCIEIQLKEYYTRPQDIKWYYLDRLFRLWPHYLFYMVLTLFFNYFFPGEYSYLSTPSIRGLIENVLILPLNFYMYNGLATFLILPPTWSLGLELVFYLTFPFIFFSRSKKIFSLLSCLVFIVAYLGIINTDIFGYRLLPGVLFIFITGSYIAEINKNQACNNHSCDFDMNDCYRQTDRQKDSTPFKDITD
jgi:peptidoglycan/LPS O-acetylase OafA/YrhL